MIDIRQMSGMTMAKAIVEDESDVGLRAPPSIAVTRSTKSDVVVIVTLSAAARVAVSNVDA